MAGKLKWVILCMLLIAGLVMGNLGCSKAGSTTTPTTTSSRPIDLIGVWSGTSVTSVASYTKYDNVVMTVTNIDGMQVWGTIAYSANRTEGQIFVASPNWTLPLNGQLSGNTLTFQQDANKRELDQHVQVSGNSMTGSGTSTYEDGTKWTWSYNLTRVR